LVGITAQDTTKYGGWYRPVKAFLVFGDGVSKSLSFKQHFSIWDARATADKKERAGYTKCSTEVLPADFEGQLMIGLLGPCKIWA